MTAYTETSLAEWRAVPARVSALLPQVLAVKAAHIKAALAADLVAQTYATWQPDTDTLTVYGPEITDAQQAKYAAQTNRSVSFSDARPVDCEKEILVKRAGLPWIAPAFDYAQKAMGGATPLTNALLVGLTAGGLGYGAGTLAENLFPERYLERGKLRRNLGLLGALSGVGYGSLAAAANAKANDKSFLQGWTIPNESEPKYKMPQIKTGNVDNDLGWLDPSLSGNSGMMAPSVDVRRMNEAIWRDTQKGFYNGFQQHTPPAYAATAAGFMSGLGTGMQSPIIRPADVVNGIASAGVGLATATVAGKALSALAGLTPVAQEKIQDLGLWGGMMHAIVPAMMGMR